jgi:hypothetical protein
MESYKHSCPFCGQHIEYTVDYCGQQMQCPSCGKTVTFPAIPPGRGKGAPSTHVKQLGSRRSTTQTQRGPLRKEPGALSFLRDFQHWKVVGQCALPFLIIGLLLAGSAVVKKTFSDTSAPDAPPTFQANPSIWHKSADVSKAEDAVRVLIQEYEVAHMTLVSAEKAKRQVEKGTPLQNTVVQQQLQLAQKNLEVTHQRLDTALDKYRDLGGTVDYRRHIPHY